MKNRTKIIAGVSLLIAVCAWAFVVFEAQDVMAHVANINANSQQIVSDEDQALATQSLRKAFLGVGEDPHILDRYFVSATGTPDFIESIENLAHANRLAVNISAVDITGSGNSQDLAMTLSVTGAWADVMHFVQLLELMPYATSLQSVDFSSADVGTAPGSTSPTSSAKTPAVWRADVQLSVASH